MRHSVTPHPVTPDAASQLEGLARFWYQMGPGSRRRRQHAAAEAERVAALRAEWRSVCHHVGLGLAVYPASGTTISTPQVGRVDFGPPVVSFTVKMRPGQPAAELMAAEPRLAEALGVEGLFMTAMRDGWVKVVVVDNHFPPPGAFGFPHLRASDDRSQGRTGGPPWP